MASPEIAIRTGVLDAMVAHAREDAPLECCGLLLMADGTIDACMRARNARASETAYLVDPRDHFAAIRRARREGLTIAGAYHSHPRSPAIPSRTDVEEASDPALLYVIVSLADARADVRAYRVLNGELVAVPFVPVA